MSFGFQPMHLVVILLAALVIFGPKNLPEVSRTVARTIVEFRKSAREFTGSFQEGISGYSSSVPAPAVQSAAPRPAETSADSTRQYCIYCGAPNSLDACFCNQCGKQIPRS
jgi:sec-independent protein translocase protein TatA